MDTIKFYYEYEPFGWLSIYHECEFYADGKLWRSTEHYYQAQKTCDPVYKEAIRIAATPDDAKKMGNCDDCSIREDWNIHRIVAMRTAIQAKFTQNKTLQDLLLETGDAVLIEDSPKDYYWGCGTDGTGRSMLGLLLMHLREELRTGLEL